MGMIGKLSAAALLAGAAASAVFWVATRPERLPAAIVSELGAGDAGRGERIFWAGGCTSCHAAPKSEGESRLQLPGGAELNTPFGVFVPPNISQDPVDGIGGWTVEDFANAMMRGVSPEGEHYYPAFPYTSYARMKPQDVADLYAYMKTLPATPGAAADHRLGFPFTVRRGLGLWKLLYLSDEPVVDFPAGAPDLVLAGRYLAEGPGHCGECHTPRDMLGGAEKARWLSGAAAAEGEGIVPNITPGEGGLKWSASEIADYLETGFTPEFDSAGGAMVEVQKNMAKLPQEDRDAIAAYLKAIPPHPNGYPAWQPAAN